MEGFAPKMKLLIVGASGLVGSALYNEAKKRGHTVLGTYLKHPSEGLQKLDYGNAKEVDKIIESFLPEVILCPAGNPNVDWAEENPQEAWKANVASLNVLFEAASKKEIPLAFFSTDYIFNGKEGPYSEEARPSPLNVYGTYKLVSELMLKTFLPDRHFIFRTTYVFGQESLGKNYVYTVVKTLSSQKELRVPSDMFATPTYSKDIARFVLATIEKNAFGTFNIAGDLWTSRLEFAKAIARTFELNESLIVPVKYSEINSPTGRPLKAGLKNQKVTKLTGLNFTPLDIALKETKTTIEQTKIIPISEKSSNSKICIFIPCYNATITLPKVLERIPKQIKDKVQEIFVVDNDSDDFTYLMAIGYREKKSDINNLKILKNVKNFGYGGSQKLAYAYAIKNDYDMVVMLHGDAQYAPEKLPVMIETMEKDQSIDLLFGSRMAGDPLKGGMPLHRYWGNKALTFIQNLLLRTKITEFHSGYRIFRTRALKNVPFHLCSSDYHFDTEMIILFIKNKFKIREVPIETYYGKEKNYVRIWQYGFNVLIATLCYWLSTKGLRSYELYKDGLKADVERIFSEFKTEIH